MKVIFLDFDGVVNDIHKREVYVNPNFVLELKKVIEKTGAKIVVTSNKRDGALVSGSFPLEDSFCYKYYVQPLEQMGIEIYDYTPFITGAKEEETRELEIEAYLKKHPEIKEFVIVEDDYVMQRLYPHQVFIEYSGGFVSAYVEPVIQILNGNLGFYPPEYDLSETFEERLRRLFPSLYLSKPFIDETKEEYLKTIGSLNCATREEYSQQEIDAMVCRLKKSIHKNR